MADRLVVHVGLVMSKMRRERCRVSEERNANCLYVVFNYYEFTKRAVLKVSGFFCF